MSQLSEWITDNNELAVIITSGVTVLITFFSLLFTIIYVRATWKLVHFPYKAFVKPMRVKMGAHMDIWFFTVKNYGPGLAVNVEVKSTQATQIKRESNREDGYYYTHISKIEGDSEIPSGDERTYTLVGMPSFPIEVHVTWKSITGKSYKSFWRVLEGEKALYSETQSIYFLLRAKNRFFRMIHKPIIMYRKREYSEVNYTIYLILQRLQRDGKLSYDYISDKLFKSDLETKKFYTT